MDYKKISEVFGTRSEPVSSIIKREDLFNKINECKIDKKHIIIYGGSKQGKTTLFNQCFKSDEYLNIQCSNFTSIEQLYQLIIDKSNIRLLQNQTNTSTNSVNGGTEVSGGGKIPLFAQANFKGSAQVTFDSSDEKKYSPLFSDLSIAQNIVEILKQNKMNKVIKLENFHYLSDEIQNKLAQDLRTFEENNLVFIILGVWTQQDSLYLKNIDLNGRMVSLTVEPWESEDFKKIINVGSDQLNIKINNDIQNEIIKNSFGNVGLLQDICKYAVKNALKNNEEEVTQEDLNNALQEYQKNERSRSVQFFNLLLEVNNSDDRLYIPYFFCKALSIFDSETLRNGIGIKEVYKKIKILREEYLDEKNVGIEIQDLVNYLTKVTSKQKEVSIGTPLIDYNKANIGSEISIIDKYFLFSLHHLTNNDFTQIIPAPTGLKNIHLAHEEQKNIENTKKISELEAENMQLKRLLANFEITETVELNNSEEDFNDEIQYLEPTDAELIEIEKENL